MSEHAAHATQAPDALRLPLPSTAEEIAEALQISELRYRRLFEMAGDGILILDSDEGKITDANPFMTELLGYSRDEMLGKQLWEIGLLQDKEASQKAFLQLRHEDYIRYENLPLRNRNGEHREVEFVSNLYREGKESVIQCNIRDITERKRIAEELAIAASKNERIAETLQRSMLQRYPAGRFAGITVETLYVAALNEAEVGGDFFDAFALGSDRVVLVVGDVSGKGLIAAGRTAEVKYALRALLHEYQSPDIALARLNDFICETHRLDNEGEEAFIVLAIAVFDASNGETTFSAAGAEPTLILRAQGTVDQVEIIGRPLGIEPDATYSSMTSVLHSGDTVLMATDGITEARRGPDFLGIEGMAALAEEAGPTASLHQIGQAIHGGARDYSGTSKGLRDDVCLLLARRT